MRHMRIAQPYTASRIFKAAQGGAGWLETGECF